MGLTISTGPNGTMPSKNKYDTVIAIALLVLYIIIGIVVLW